MLIEHFFEAVERVFENGAPLSGIAQITKWSKSSQRGSQLEVYNQLPGSTVRDIVDARGHPRFKLEVDISIHPRSGGLVKGHTVDISESGISVMLRTEVLLGELVELDFTLPLGPVTIYAVARQKNAFRYGFQFVKLDAMNEVIRSTCHRLAVEQS